MTGKSAADRGEDFVDRFEVGFGDPSARGVGGSAFLHECGGVGHDAHDVAILPRRFLQGVDGDTGHDGDEQLALDFAAGLGDRRERVFGFDAKHDHVGSGGHLAVAADHADSALRAEHFRRFGHAVVHVHFGGFA